MNLNVISNLKTKRQILWHCDPRDILLGFTRLLNWVSYLHRIGVFNIDKQDIPYFSSANFVCNKGSLGLHGYIVVICYDTLHCLRMSLVWFLEQLLPWLPHSNIGRNISICSVYYVGFHQPSQHSKYLTRLASLPWHTRKNIIDLFVNVNW